MAARLYVGNLAYETQAAGLKELVEDGGHPVADVHIVTDRETGRSRGFAFVELTESENLAAAIEALDGQTLDGRRLAVSEARPRKPREGGAPRGGRDFGSGPRSGPSRHRSEARGAPEREHRRPFGDRNGEGARSEGRSYQDRKPRRDPAPFGGGPPPGAGFGPGELPAKDEGRRRNKKWKDKGRSEDRDEVKSRDDRGGRKRRGGGRRGGWDQGDDW